MQEAPIRLGLFGADGRMGQRVLDCVDHFPSMVMQTCVDRDTPSDLRFDACDVVLDFAIADATSELLARLRGTGAALVTGVTARAPTQHDAVWSYAKEAAVFGAANFSVGIALLRTLVERAATALGPDWDTEVFEMHHRRKVDAPSGTALMLGRTAARARGLPWPEARADSRATRARDPAEIGFAALRGGDVTGEHTVYFMGDGERVELVHRAMDRRVFALGALRAARWVYGRPPGRYGMDDLLT